jgi:hypothetical protein
MHAHPIHRGIDLLEIGDIGADAKGIAAGVFDFQMRQIQFRLAASKQAYSIAGGRKPDRQPLTDASARTRYEHADIR